MSKPKTIRLLWIIDLMLWSLFGLVLLGSNNISLILLWTTLSLITIFTSVIISLFDKNSKEVKK